MGSLSTKTMFSKQLNPYEQDHVGLLVPNDIKLMNHHKIDQSMQYKTLCYLGLFTFLIAVIRCLFERILRSGTTLTRDMSYYCIETIGAFLGNSCNYRSTTQTDRQIHYAILCASILLSMSLASLVFSGFYVASDDEWLLDNCDDVFRSNLPLCVFHGYPEHLDDLKMVMRLAG